MQIEPGDAPDRFGELSVPARLLLCALFLFLAELLCPALGDVVLRSTGFYAWFYGPDQAQRAHELTDRSLAVRQSLWLYAVTFPLWAAGVTFFFRTLKVVPPAQVGLTVRHARRNVLWGNTAAMLLIPPVLGLNIVAVWFFQTVLQLPIKEHPFSFIGRHEMLRVEWVLLAFAVVVSAPIREELLFRGVLQRLFIVHPWGSHVAMGMALAVALVRQPGAAEAFTTGVGAVVSANLPVLFVLAMVPVYLLVWLRSKTTRPPAVFGTALFFGAIHSFAWPTPIALFVLGLGLGYLTLRTRSLVAPVVVHSLFNGVSFVLLLAGWDG